jgi:hypothetical protein
MKRWASILLCGWILWGPEWVDTSSKVMQSIGPTIAVAGFDTRKECESAQANRDKTHGVFSLSSTNVWISANRCWPAGHKP